MALDVVLVVIGLLALGGGGEILVRGAVGVARRHHVTPAVIGLTVVAAGTSMPELWASLGAQLRGSPDLAVGNVIGSNIFNIGLILGLSSLVIAIPVSRKTLRIEWPFLLLISIAVSIFLLHGSIGRLAGLLFVVALAAFLGFMVRLTRRDMRANREVVEGWNEGDVLPSASRSWTLVAAGLVLLPLGAEGVVRGSIGIAQAMGISERVIGITIVAMGTSLPELASSLVAAARGRSDVAVGNVIGSNLFNTLGILGAVAFVRPLPVSAAFRGDVWWMLAFTALLAPILYFGRKISRMDGLALLVLFGLYMGVLLNN